MSTNETPLYGLLYGSFYFASVMSVTFYGVTCMQTYFYYVHYRNDPLRIKIFVATMWTFNTIHEALCVAGTYKYILAGLVNPSSALTLIPELIVQILFTTLVALPTQGFLVYRIYTFSGRNILGPIIWVPLALVKFVCTFIYAGKALYSKNGVHVVSISTLNGGLSETLATISFSVAATVDVLIAISMTFLLIRERATATFARTAHILHRLTMFAVNTGVWTAVFAFMTVILLHASPKSALYCVFAIPLCSVYCNTLLANLNGRAYIQGQEATNVHMDVFNPGPNSWSDSVKGNKERGDVNSSFSAH